MSNLKTIQEYLKEYNRKTLVDAYCYKYPVSSNDLYVPDDRTIAEIREKQKEVINRSIDYLCSIKPKEDDEPCFLLAHHILNPVDIGEDINFTLIPLSKMNKESLSGYSFILSPTEEIMGYYVSDAYTTQYQLEDLLVWFLYEATFFGYEREGVEAEAAELERRDKELKEGKAKTVPADEVFKELGRETGWVPEERNKEEEKEEHELMLTIWKFNHRCLLREIKETKKLYEKEE